METRNIDYRRKVNNLHFKRRKTLANVIKRYNLTDLEIKTSLCKTINWYKREWWYKKDKRWYKMKKSNAYYDERVLN